MRMVWAYLCLHSANLSVRYNLRPVAAFRPFHLDKNLIASLMSQLLRTRFTMVETHYGGCTLDVDNTDHYDAICANFERWQNYQNDLANELKQQA